MLKIVELISKSGESNIVLDFSNNRFVTPIFVVPLLVFINGSDKKIEFTNLGRYLETICLNVDGLKPELMGNQLFENHIKSFSSRTYLPIINFSAQLNQHVERNLIMSTVESILKNQLNIDMNVMVGLKYIIQESIDNIVEHSQSNRAYVFCQSYPRKKHLDICIADNGITLLGSYLKSGLKDIYDHYTAIVEANKGVSTKNLPDAENRGYGIITSKKMLVNGLKGNYVMLSGNALHLKSADADEYLVLPGSISLKGTIVAIRVPYFNTDFNYSNYLE